MSGSTVPARGTTGSGHVFYYLFARRLKWTDAGDYEAFVLFVHPLQAPRTAWWLYGKEAGMRYWLRLLRWSYFYPGRFPWCGWADFWDARPWNK